jgi:starch-binding outer membrane protein, SusD/RagB family
MKTMRTTTYILITLSILLGACSKMLDIEPTDAISSSEAIKDKSGVEKAIAGSYDAFQLPGLYGRERVILGDLAADNLVWSGTNYDYAQIDNNNVSIENGLIDGMWSGAYDGINRVNNILAALPGINDLSDAERDKYEGEALFMRALFHFNLLTYFGGVPVMTEPTLDLTHLDRPRNSAAEVYDQIISDLGSAELKLPLPSAMPEGRANSFSAAALLARVYLTRFHAENDDSYALLAANKADQVIEQGGFSLVSSYPSLYEGSDNSERIFQIAFSAQDKNRLAEYFTPTSMAGRYEVAPSESLAQAFDPADSIRLKASIAKDKDNQLYCIKYTELVEGSDPVLVIRLAEMYLIKAEAMAYTNGDIATIRENIDIIRARAGLQPTTAETYDELKLAIENERRFEFAFEGHRWFDLVRTKRATTVLNIDEYQTLFPIPLSEMSTNKLMEQNPGY